METIPKIPGYIIQKEIGAGGTSTVYMGIQNALNRKVAIKILKPTLLDNNDFSFRFLREAEIASKLVHPNIVSIFDVGQSGDYLYILMEYLGDSLKDKMRRVGILPIDDILRIVKEVARALGYAHAQGVLHRDIKPANILFRDDGTPVIVDFGLALSVDTTLMLTEKEKIVGTLCYMSPEQCKGERFEQASDIYSLGVVLFEMLKGEVPYSSNNPNGILAMHINDPVPQLPEYLNCFQPLIDQMMAKDKKKRFQNGKQVIDMIDNLIADQIGEDTSAFEGINEEKKKEIKQEKRKLLILLVLSLIAFLTVIIVIITRLR